MSIVVASGSSMCQSSVRASRRNGEFWLACDTCDRWFDGKCVQVCSGPCQQQRISRDQGASEMLRDILPLFGECKFRRDGTGVDGRYCGCGADDPRQSSENGGLALPGVCAQARVLNYDNLPSTVSSLGRRRPLHRTLCSVHLSCSACRTSGYTARRVAAVAD